MLSMAQSVENNVGGHIHIAYEGRATSVAVTINDGGRRTTARFPVVEFDKMIEQYMYLRQYSNGRRAR